MSGLTTFVEVGPGPGRCRHRRRGRETRIPAAAPLATTDSAWTHHRSTGRLSIDGHLGRSARRNSRGRAHCDPWILVATAGSPRTWTLTIVALAVLAVAASGSPRGSGWRLRRQLARRVRSVCQGHASLTADRARAAHLALLGQTERVHRLREHNVVPTRPYGRARPDSPWRGRSSLPPGDSASSRSGGLDPCLCLDSPAGDGGGQRGVVELVLVGVELGEAGQCLL
jgi:hypothetical protein